MTQCHPRIIRMTESMLNQVKEEAARKALAEARDSLEAIPLDKRGYASVPLLRAMIDNIGRPRAEEVSG